MSYPFTPENHVAFMKERERLEDERAAGNIITLDEDPGVRALRRMIALKKKFNCCIDKIRETMGDQYSLAENELISRAGDPNRFNAKTGGWIVWP
jgi:hypothetical protein